MMQYFTIIIKSHHNYIYSLCKTMQLLKAQCKAEKNKTLKLNHPFFNSVYPVPNNCLHSH